MANNLAVKDASGTARDIKTTDTASVHTPHHNVDSLPALVAGEAHIGALGGNSTIVPITFTLDTAAYASGDVLADTQALAAAVRTNAGFGVVASIVLNDEDDKGNALDVVFLDANTSLGTENAAPSISDANARNILGIVSVAAGDWTNIGGVRVATLRNINLPIKGASGSTSVYIALISKGTGTYTASGITGRISILQD